MDQPPPCPGPARRGPGEARTIGRRHHPATLALSILLLTTTLVPAATIAETTDEGSRWAPIDEATIRPGIKVQIEGHGWCTANFVFTEATGDDLFLGTAGHCVGLDVGAAVRAPSDTEYVTGQLGLEDAGPVIGHIAYSSRAELGVTSEPCLVVLSCGGHPNDFALVRIDEAYEDEVHPAMIAFGGPTEMAPAATVDVGDRLLSYGNSPLRPGPGVVDERVGVVVGPADPWTVQAYFASPAIPGDSGSPVISEDGQAVGLLTTLSTTGANGVTALEPVLAFAEQRGVDVELATWEMLGPAAIVAPGGGGELPAG